MRLIDADALKQSDFQDFSNTDVLYAIDHAPTIDPVIHAEWLESKTTYAGADRKNMNCTRCGDMITVGRKCPKEKLYPYCPFCGAKMDNESKGETE